MIIGLTGGIGAGKSTVRELFSQLGVPTNSADIISKDVLNENPQITAAIIKRFQSLDRKDIRHKIFNSAEDRQWLEKQLHPKKKKKILAFAQNLTAPYCVVEIPLLIETGSQDSCDRILSVDCSEAEQIKRASLRDHSDEQEIRAIIATQITRKERLAASDDILQNTGDQATLKQAVLKLHQQYLQLAASKNN